MTEAVILSVLSLTQALSLAWLGWMRARIKQIEERNDRLDKARDEAQQAYYRERSTSATLAAVLKEAQADADVCVEGGLCTHRPHCPVVVDHDQRVERANGRT